MAAKMAYKMAAQTLIGYNSAIYEPIWLSCDDMAQS